MLESNIAGAYRVYIKEQKIENENFSIKLAYNFTLGKGTNHDQNSILIRPFNKLLELGSLPGKVNFLSLMENKQFYILGAFCRTQKRILFFPCIREHEISKDTDIKINNQKIDTKIDHISLENSLLKWHISFLKKKEFNTNAYTQRTFSINNDLFLWFVWRFKSVENLELVPLEQEIVLNGKEEEVKRRAALMMESIRASHSAACFSDEQPSEPFFWNIEFFVSKTRELNFPPVPGYCLSDPASIVKDQREFGEGGVFWLSIDDFDGLIWVRVSKLIGSLLSDHVIIPPSETFKKMVSEIINSKNKSDEITQN